MKILCTEKAGHTRIKYNIPQFLSQLKNIILREKFPESYKEYYIMFKLSSNN